MNSELRTLEKVYEQMVSENWRKVAGAAAAAAIGMTGARSEGEFSHPPVRQGKSIIISPEYLSKSPFEKWMINLKKQNIKIKDVDAASILSKIPSKLQHEFDNTYTSSTADSQRVVERLMRSASIKVDLPTMHKIVQAAKKVTNNTQE